MPFCKSTPMAEKAILCSAALQHYSNISFAVIPTIIDSTNDTILGYDNVSSRFFLENKKNLSSTITGSFSKYLLRNL